MVRIMTLKQQRFSQSDPEFDQSHHFISVTIIITITLSSLSITLQLQLFCAKNTKLQL